MRNYYINPILLGWTISRYSIILWSLYYIPLSSSSSASSQYNNNNSVEGGGLSKIKYNNDRKIILIDVDNTLYNEMDHHIEYQIIQNIYHFIQKYVLNINNNNHDNEYNQSKRQEAIELADQLHLQYGTTIDGLKHTIWKHNNKELLKKQQQLFYNNVYQSINVRSLLSSTTSSFDHHKNRNNDEHLKDDNTGYSHSNNHNTNQISILRQRLKLLSLQYKLHITSNSPIYHVQKIIQAMGLTRIPWSNIWTPDHPTSTRILSYPTKQYPNEFYSLASWHNNNKRMNQNQTTTLFFIDDSNMNIKAFQKYVTQQQQFGSYKGYGIHVNNYLNKQHQEQQSSNNNHTKKEDVIDLQKAIDIILDWPIKANDQYTFNETRYIQEKNIVDRQSYNRETYKKLLQEIQNQITIMKHNNINNIQQQQQQQQNESSIIIYRIVDLGAGLLSMLRLIIEGCYSNDDDGEAMPSLLEVFQQQQKQYNEIHYYAYESNIAFQSLCIQELNRLGFIIQSSSSHNQHSINIQEHDTDDNYEMIFIREVIDDDHKTSTTTIKRLFVHLRFASYEKYYNKNNTKNNSSYNHMVLPPHLIIGCCFADLIEPYHLIRSLLYHFLSSSSTTTNNNNNDNDNSEYTLLYFPITFNGITQLLPPQPIEYHHDYQKVIIPSDTTALSLYSKVLMNKFNHNLDPILLEEAIMDHGGICIHRGKSDWMIRPQSTTMSSEEITEQESTSYPTDDSSSITGNVILTDNNNDYLWFTMLYFFNTVVSSELYESGYDAASWLHRIKKNKPTIHVSNIDLLFRLPHLGKWKYENKNFIDKNSISSYQEIQFIAPMIVGYIEKQSIPTIGSTQVRIRSICSLISSGTELKIFKGTFDNDSILDVNIKGMDTEQMKYPLSYGYSLVGRVVECGDDVIGRDKLIGKLIFTFSAHASEVIVDINDIHIIPDGIDPFDAIFMPSVETALSLVHDAHPILGENIAVFGQGLIGLLVTAILSKSHTTIVNDSKMTTGKFAAITTFDTNPNRLAASAAMGSLQALYPTDAKRCGPFDVSIEVSGNSRALQTAIDVTQDGGRIIIGSWYGNQDMMLRLGIDFHRSHKSLKASQVSIIPAELSRTWTKSRRFDFVWELIRSLTPSRLLLSRRMALSSAQEVYTALDNGNEIAIAFEY